MLFQRVTIVYKKILVQQNKLSRVKLSASEVI